MESETMILGTNINEDGSTNPGLDENGNPIRTVTTIGGDELPENPEDGIQNTTSETDYVYNDIVTGVWIDKDAQPFVSQKSCWNAGMSIFTEFFFTRDPRIKGNLPPTLVI